MTQSELGGFGWNQADGIVLGAALVVGTFFIHTSYTRRLRMERRERPPQTARLLRPAGYSLQCRLDELREKWSETVLQALVSGSVLGLLGSALWPIIEGLLLQQFSLRELWANPKAYLLLSISALAISRRHGLSQILPRRFGCNAISETVNLECGGNKQLRRHWLMACEESRGRLARQCRHRG